MQGLEGERYRENHRIMVNDPEFAKVLFERTKHLLQRDWGKPDEDLFVDGLAGVPFGVSCNKTSSYWRPVGLNPCMRICKYSPGGYF